MKMKPINRRVVIRKHDVDEVTKSGIIIPEIAKEKPMQGSIVAVDEESVVKLKVGDVVLFGKFAGTVFQYESEEYLLLKEEDVFMKLED